MSTPDHKVAEAIGRSIDGRIFRLQEERRTLEQAPARITEIDAEIAILLLEQTRINERRPPRPQPDRVPPVADARPERIR